MKVTSFEISKKLAEIGFNKDHDYNYRFGCDTGWQIETGWASKERGDIPAHDLETILNALPKKIEMGGDTKELILNIANSELSYTSEDNCYYTMSPNGTYPNGTPKDIIVFRNKDKSLADTAARLLMKLHEAGLVKFKEE